MPHRIKEFHYITPISNLISILNNGILSHNKAEELPHCDISMVEVQQKRKTKKLNDGLCLHDYVNLYFDARNPMMYSRKEKANEICVLRISKDVLEIGGVYISDGNASSDYSRYYSPDRIGSLNFNKIYSRDWNHPEDLILTMQCKSAKCAEVLVPYQIKPDYIMGAYTVNQIIANQIKSMGFLKEIELNPDLFFWGN